jgi:cytochrome P450
LLSEISQTLSIPNYFNFSKYPLYGNTIISLLEDHDQHMLLQSDDELLSSTVEETLCYRSPVQAVVRIVTKDIDLGQKRILSGQRTIAWIGSANLLVLVTVFISV